MKKGKHLRNFMPSIAWTQCDYGCCCSVKLFVNVFNARQKWQNDPEYWYLLSMSFVIPIDTQETQLTIEHIEKRSNCDQT